MLVIRKSGIATMKRMLAARETVRDVWFILAFIEIEHTGASGKGRGSSTQGRVLC